MAVARPGKPDPGATRPRKPNSGGGAGLLAAERPDPSGGIILATAWGTPGGARGGDKR